MKTKQENLKNMRQYNTERILSGGFKPIVLNVKLTNNPFLKDQEKFHYLVYRLNDYNRRVGADLIRDQF